MEESKAFQPEKGSYAKHHMFCKGKGTLVRISDVHINEDRKQSFGRSRMNLN
jgi:hypothetical protein